jgi:hypothetical protein
MVAHCPRLTGSNKVETFNAVANGEFYPINSDTTAALA